ncbi:hypothetical protein [Spirosoma sordidisoli]|nr:hypothetical protein [Spirosoma sordidisoli]
MNEIDTYARDGRADYHHFSVETIVCNKADGNTNCTKEKVFELMKSRKDFNVFKADEFPYATGNSSGASLVADGFQLIGSDLIFKIDDTPVSNCEVVNLAGPLSMAVNLKQLYDYSREYGFNKPSYYAVAKPFQPEQSNIPIANPIAQFIDESTFTITNYTKPGHVFYPGKVVRSVIEDCDRIKIVTIGVGRHYLADLGYPLIGIPPVLNPLLSFMPVQNAAAGAVALGKSMGEQNATAGPRLFKRVDFRLREAFTNLPR